MATYYRWRKSTVNTNESQHQQTGNIISKNSNVIYFGNTRTNSNGSYTFNEVSYSPDEFPASAQMIDYDYFRFGNSSICYGSNAPNSLFLVRKNADETGFSVSVHVSGFVLVIYTLEVSPGTSLGYVYSTIQSTYPNGGVSSSYYYDQRTTVTSPTAPSNLTYPNPITTPTVTVSWDAATSNTDYPVDHYDVDKLSSNSPGGQWLQAYNGSGTSFEAGGYTGATTIQYRIRARDSNGQYSDWTTGPVVSVYMAPTLTVPQMVMQGQQATINWSTIEGADSYILQRKSSADADWTQVYSGADLSYTETVGTWTSLQYRVQAVFDGTPGGWATSGDIQIVSASALVISGQDGDLGTLTNDVSYSISSDQTSPTIDVTVEVNGGEYTAFQATSGKTYKVGILDLPTGTGSIVITASAEVSDSPVTVTRNWTYSKTAQTFPNSGSVAALTKEGNVVYPETLPEAVRTPMNPWGGNLGTALELLKQAALFNRTKRPKYSEVTIDLSALTQTDAQNGKIINLPVNGVMVPHRVVHIGNPDPDLYDASCDGVWLLRKDIVSNGQWNTSMTNTLSVSAIMTTMQEYVDDYDTTVQAAIKNVKIPFCIGNGSTAVNGGVNGLSCKIFPLGCCELGYTVDNHPDVPTDGAKLDYFLSGGTDEANQRRLGNNNLTWWTRSADTSNSTTAWYVTNTGMLGKSYTNHTEGFRYCFLLPTTFSASYYVDQNGNIHDQQEYTEAGNWLDMWGSVIPAVHIETGSYVGTGTSGASNPNTLTFSSVPKFVFICGETTTPMEPGGGGAHYIQAAFLVYNNPECIRVGNGVGTLGNVQWEGNSVSWYSENLNSAPFYQLNTSGITYDYVAIG